jgi:hypothetical protein
MGRAGFDKDRRNGSGKKRPASPRDRRPRDGGRDRTSPPAGETGPARLLLTRLLRDSAVWDVYVATIAESGSPVRTRLEFVESGGPLQATRYTRPIAGPMLDALLSGMPVSRASLLAELEQALVDAGVATAGRASVDAPRTADASQAAEPARAADAPEAEAARATDAPEAAETRMSDEAPEAAEGRPAAARRRRSPRKTQTGSDDRDA